MNTIATTGRTHRQAIAMMLCDMVCPFQLGGTLLVFWHSISNSTLSGEISGSP
jgi:hypothetical protein